MCAFACVVDFKVSGCFVCDLSCDVALLVFVGLNWLCVIVCDC